MPGGGGAAAAAVEAAMTGLPCAPVVLARTIPPAPATWSLPGDTSWKAAMVDSVRRPEERDDGVRQQRPDGARGRIDEPERSDRKAERGSGRVRGDECELRAERPEIEGGRPVYADRMADRPIGRLDDHLLGRRRGRAAVAAEPGVRADRRRPEIPVGGGRRFRRGAVRIDLAEERVRATGAAVDEQAVPAPPTPSTAALRCGPRSPGRSRRPGRCGGRCSTRHSSGS